MTPGRRLLTRREVEGRCRLLGVPAPWGAPVPGGERSGTPGPPVAAGDEALDDPLDLALVRSARAPVHLDLDLALRSPGARPDAAPLVQLHAWHRWEGRAVTATATVGGRVEVGWFGIERWAGELARALSVPGSEPGERAPGAALELPHDVVVGVGEALATDRPDLTAALCDRHDLDAASRAAAVRLHTAARGRARVVTTARDPRGAPRVGLLSWVLLEDGWRRLEPVLRASTPTVRVVPATPRDLAAHAVRTLRVVTANGVAA